MISFLKKLKLKLQFTGWLQYLLTIIIALLFIIIALPFFYFGLLKLAYFLFAISATLLLITLFDIATIKYNLRPLEGISSRRDNMNTFDVMRARVACRAFQNRTLRPSDLSELMDVVRQIHSQKNDLIGKYPIRLEYINERLTVWPVVGAQEFLVAIAPKKYNRQSVIDVGRNLQKVVTHATRMGLATCWIGPGADHGSVITHLGDRFNSLENHIICVCAIGYKSKFLPLTIRLAQKTQRNRLPISSLFFSDAQFKNPLNIEAIPFNRFGRCYEVCQWSPSSFNGQTTRCVAVVKNIAGNSPTSKNARRLNRFDFYATTKSRYYAAVALGIWCANWEIGCDSLDIKGHFEILSEQDRDLSANNPTPEYPKYDISWMVEDID